MKIHVGNLAKEITDVQFSELAVPFGLSSSTVAREHQSGLSKGFGFIEYRTSQEATAAIAGLNGREVSGQTLKVSEAKSQTSKDPLGGKY